MATYVEESAPRVILSEGRSPKSNPKGDATASGSPSLGPITQQHIVVAVITPAFSLLLPLCYIKNVPTSHTVCGNCLFIRRIQLPPSMLHLVPRIEVNVSFL